MPWNLKSTWANISKEISQTKQLVEKRFSDRIRIIGKLVERQTSLTGIYTKEILVRKAARLKYQDNAILNNTLLNLPYRGLSVLLLIRNTFYGSARIVCRQFFESLMIAKYGEHDSTIIRKWEMKDYGKPGRDRSTEISLGPDVFVKLEARGKNITTLRQTWRDLCNADHPTKFSQHFLRFPDAKDKREFGQNG